MKLSQIKNEKLKIGIRGGVIKNWINRTCLKRTRCIRLHEKDIQKEEFRRSQAEY